MIETTSAVRKVNVTVAVLRLVSMVFAPRNASGD
jgi:hypothetical protein